MNKKRHFLFTLIVTIMCVSMILFAVACDNKDEKPNADPSATTDELFTNGEFTLFTGDNYPKLPNSWTPAAGSSSSPVGSDNVISGVIDTDAKSFKNNQKTYGKIANPSTGGDKDSFILMIYNKTKTSQKYTSASVSLDKASYYKLSFKVKTNLEQDAVEPEKQAAYAYLNGDAFAAFKEINTNGEWVGYSVFIESSIISTSSINLTLSLGNGTDYAKGYAFFDSIVLEKVDEAAYTAAQVNDNTAKYSMIQGDSEFDYTSGTSTILTPVKYSGLAGTGSGESAPSSSSYVDKGIYNLSKTASISNNNTNIELTKPADSIGNNILVINNKQATAYGFRSQTPFRFEAKSYYAVSIMVRTENIEKGGVTIKITNGKENDDRNFQIKDVQSKKNEWTTVSLYVEANETRNNDLYLEMWLGQGGKNDTDQHVKGVAMFDCIKIAKITEEKYNEQASDTRFSLKSKDTQPIDSAKFISTVYDETIPTGLTEYEAKANSIVINNTKPTAFSASNFVKGADDNVKDVLDKPITIYPNNFYLISMLVKTEKIDKAAGLNVSLISIKEDITKYDEAINTLATLSNLNSENLKDYEIEGGFTEIKFFVKGGIFKANNVGLSFTLGSGKATQSAGHVIGKATIQDIKIESITSSEYSNATSGTVTASASFTETSGSNEVSSNGAFKLIDANATKELYKDLKKNATDSYEIFDNQGKLSDVLGVPSNWTISSKDAITKENYENRSQSGVLDLENDKLVSEFGINKDTFYDGSQMNMEDNKTVLAFNAKNAAFSYSSDNISLSANSYYKFSIWAKTIDNAKMSIELATKTGAGKEGINFYNASTKNNNWENFVFYVRTGVSSISVKLTLSVGNPTVAQGANGIVFFNEAKYTTMTEDQFNKAQESATDHNKIQSWFVDSFDTSAPSSELSTPTNWSGAIIDSESKSDKENLVSGVFDKTSGNWDNLDIVPDSDENNGSALYEAIFPVDDTLAIGDSVLAIYNKKATTYKYTSTATTLKDNTFYKVSISVLTYGLGEKDSAFITLKLNNQTYTFGKLLDDNSSETDKSRQINTSTYADGVETVGTWKQYNFYVKTEKDVKPSATVAVGLGYNDKDNWKKGYLFVDNFSVEEIKEEDFVALKEQPDVAEGDIDQSLIADETLIPTTHRIVLTEEFANAEENKSEPEKEEEKAPDKSKDLLWLWISSGIVGGVILVVLVVFLIKKYGKKKFKK